MNFIIVLTDKCNLRCKYCYEKEKTYSDMSVETARKSILFVKDCITREIDLNRKEHNIVFHGGEPLLKYDMIKYFVIEFNKISNVKIQYYITSNGTIFKEEIAYFIKNNNINFSISIDGTKSSHDKNRVFPDGRGSYNMVIDNSMKYLSIIENIRCRLTFSPDTINEIYSGVSTLSELGFCIFAISENFYCTEWQDNSIESESLANNYTLEKSTQVDIKSFLASKTRVSDVTNTYAPDESVESEQNITNTDSTKVYFEEANHNNNILNAQNNIIKSNDIDKDDVIIKKQIALKAPAIKEFDFESLAYKGYLFDTYIIMQSADVAYLLDQHAAHERIMYERFITMYNDSEHVSQPILIPFSVETSSDVYAAERLWMDDLAKLGFDIDDFGNNTFIVRGIPTYMDKGEAELFLQTYIEDPESRTERGNTTVIDKLIMRSCKAAVKGNNKLSTMEIEELLDQLSSCINPFSCPHGRPTFIRFTLSEISRAFKR